MTLPPHLQRAVESTLQTRVRDAALLTGGMINQAARVTTEEGMLFLKWHPHAPAGFFEAEVRGLALLREAGTLRVPQVLAWHDVNKNESDVERQEATPAWLAQEWIERAAPHDEAAFARDFAEALAAQHHVTAPQHGNAAGRANFLGEFVQDNTPSSSWAEFWRDCRLLPLIALGTRNGRLAEPYRALLLRVVEASATLLDDCDTQPALLHGDLWSGNFMAVQGAQGQSEGVIFDPATYFGSREMEMAYVELFGGFPRGIMRFYHAAYPLPARYEARRPLLQIYPLLVHYLHFGAEYGPPLERACHQTLSI